MKSIYELDLHESIVVQVDRLDKKGTPYSFQVTRLPSGWLYTDYNPSRRTSGEFFVPFDNIFQNE